MKWILKRVLSAFLTILLSATFMFCLIRLMPGNPVDAFVAWMMQQYYGTMSYEEIMAMAKTILGFMPKAPLWKQYLQFLKGVFTGNLGKSITYQVPVTEMLSKALGWSVFLLSIALVLSFTIGILFGMFLAYRRGTKFESFMTTFLMCWRGVPDYIVGLVLLWVFGFTLKWFPTRGAYSPTVTPGFNLPFIIDVIKHAVLPVTTYVLVHVAFWTLMMRGSTISVLGEDYVTAAEARGLPSRRIIISYVGKNAILPLFTLFLIAIGWIFSGSVFIETIFNYPGIGYYLVQAVNLRDWTLMQGAFLIIIIAVVLGCFLADVLYAYLDPRVRIKG